MATQMIVFTKKYWDRWLQKFFALFISLKFLCIIIVVIFRIINFISGGQLITGILGILGIRGIIQIRRVMNNHKNKKGKVEDVETILKDD